MKMQCVMKDSWRISNFPFDRQTLRLSIENSQYDSKTFVFVADTVGKHYDPRFTLSGWNIDSCILMTGVKAYETGFGDESLVKPHTEYSNFRVRLSLHRDASGLFWKMFLGMYVAFLIADILLYFSSDTSEIMRISFRKVTKTIRHYTSLRVNCLSEGSLYFCFYE